MLKSFLFSLAMKHVLEVKRVRSKQEHFVVPFSVREKTKFACPSENTLTDTEMGGNLSVKSKGSQVPRVNKTSGGGVVHLPFQGKKVMTSFQ